MRKIKNVLFRNYYGEVLECDNRMHFFCESIKTAQTTGRFITEQPAFAAGQITTDYSAQAKIIQISFALRDREDDVFLREKVLRVLAPMMPGELIVQDQYDSYRIECYPASVAQPEQDKNDPAIFRWTTDFVADYPFWERGAQKQFSYGRNQVNQTLRYGGMVPVSPVITFPAGGEHVVVISNPVTGGTGFTITTQSKAVTVDCRTMTITDEDGADCSHYLDASAQLDRILMAPGNNTVWGEIPSGGNPIIIKWHDLVVGVI